MEPAIFGAFIILEGIFHAAPDVFNHLKQKVWLQKLNRHHYAVWLFHPIVWHGIAGYVVHFVVYSGQILGVH
jgi:hypothetical protein